jgi:hypothetical protein
MSTSTKDEINQNCPICGLLLQHLSLPQLAVSGRAAQDKDDLKGQKSIMLFSQHSV